MSTDLASFLLKSVAIAEGADYEPADLTKNTGDVPVAFRATFAARSTAMSPTTLGPRTCS